MAPRLAAEVTQRGDDTAREAAGREGGSAGQAESGDTSSQEHCHTER